MQNIYVLLITTFFVSMQQAMLNPADVNNIVSPEINAVDKDGHSPLYYGVQTDNVEMVRFLLDNKANPNLPDDQYSPLYTATHSLSVDMVRLLLDFNANPNNTKNPAREPLLITAIRVYGAAYEKEKKLKAKENILHLVACPNIDRTLVNKQGKTPLHWAVEKDMLEIVKLLLTGNNAHKDNENNN